MSAAQQSPNIAPYAEAWRRRLAEERAAAAESAAAARADAVRCADLLIEQFGATRVFLFGSAARGSSRPFRASSDLDLAVEGLPDARYFAALAALGRLTSDRIPIDLVPLETAPPPLHDRVLATGELLRERT